MVDQQQRDELQRNNQFGLSRDRDALDKGEQTQTAFWGMVAIAAGAIAVGSSLLSFAVPGNLNAIVHAKIGDTTSPEQLEARVAAVLADQDRIIAENEILRLQLMQLERERGRVSERLSSLEVAIPALLEVVPPDAVVDRSLTTASIAEEARNRISYEVDGGSVVVTQRPLFANPTNQVLPELLSLEPDAEAGASAGSTDSDETMIESDPDQNGVASAEMDEAMMLPEDFGVALGDSFGEITRADLPAARAAWTDMLNKVGLLLIGTEPQIVDPLGSGIAKLVAGPLPDLQSAENICDHVVTVGIDCRPVQYDFDADKILAF